MGQLTNQYVSSSYQGLLKMTDSTTGVTGTLQTVQTGDGTNTPLQISQTQINISGSLTVNGIPVTSVNTGSLVTTSSFNAYTSSNDARVNSLISQTGSYVTETESGSFMITGSVAGDTLTFTKGNGSQFSLQVNTGSLPAGVVSGSAQVAAFGYATTSSVTSLSSSIATTDLNQNNVIAGLATTSSLTSLSSSIATTDLAQNNRLTSLEGVTGSINRNGLITTGSVGGNQSITGSVDISGTLTATSASFTYVNTVYETASVIYSSGSNQFGDASDDTQTLWGTVNLPTGPLTITGSLHSTNIKGTGSLFLQPNQGDARFVEIYNTSPTDTHITASGGQIFLGDDQTYVKVDNYGSVERIDIVAGNELVVSSSVVNVTGSLHQSGTFYPDQVDWINSSITQETGSYVLTTDTSGITHYDTYQNVASALQPFINTGSLPSGLVSGSSQISYTGITDVPSGIVSGSQQIVDLGFATTSSVNQKLDTGSFNSYTASMDTRTGSYITTGSAAATQSITGSLILSGSAGPELDVKGDVIITGSVNVSGSVNVNGPVSLLPGTGTPTTPGLNLGGNTSNKIWVSGSNNDVYLRSIADIMLTAGNNGNLKISGPGGTTPISASIVGNTQITGSLDVRSGSLSTISNNTTVNIDLYLTNSLGGQSNIIKGWGENPAAGGAGATQANYTGSLRITGSNNTVSLPQIRATNFGGGTDLQGYISGSDNTLMTNTSGIYLNTGSLLFPKITNNYLGAGSSILMNFTTSSLAGGHPLIQNNTLYAGQIAINSNSGSLASAGNLINGASVTSTQNFVTNVRPSIGQNIINGSVVTLNHISSSINYSSNINNSPVTINNHLSSSNITNNSLTFTNNTILGGSSATGLSLWVSGSQNSNATRTISDNLIGGKNIIVSSSFVSSSTSNLVSSLIYGQNLIVSGNHASTVGGSTFVGRYNDATSLHLAQDVVFAVGTGTGTSTRRTGLYVTSGSLVGVSGSMLVNGQTQMTASNGFPLYVSGTIQTQRLHFDGNPFNSNPSSNLGALRMGSDNQTFQYTNYDLAQITTQSFIDQFVNTGSLVTRTTLGARYAGTEVKMDLTNNNGSRRIDFLTDSMTVTGSVNLSSDLFMYGHKMFNVGAFTSTQTQSGSAAVSQSINYNITDISQGVSLNGGGTQMIFANAGTYNIQFSAQVLANTGSDDVWFWLKKNGTNVSNSSGRITLANNEELMAAWNYVVDANAGDYYELVWESSGGDALLLFNTAAGNYPAVPSVITTVTQVR